MIISLATSAALMGQTDLKRQIGLHFERGQNALQTNQPGLAAAEFQTVLRLDPRSAAAYANLGMIAFQASEYDDAVKSFSMAVKLNPFLVDAHAFLPPRHARLGHNDAARPLLEKALRRVQNPTLRTEMCLELIRIAQATNTLESTVDALREMQRSSPDDPEVLYLAYRIYSDLAPAFVSKLSQSRVESGRLRQILAHAALSQDDTAGAVGEYRKALEINPNDGNAEFGPGEVQMFRSNLAVAMERYQRALMLPPDFADAHLALVRALHSLGRSGEALPHFQAARPSGATGPASCIWGFLVHATL